MDKNSKNYAKWKVTKFKWGWGGSPCFSLQGTAWMSCCPIYGALYPGIMQQPLKTSLLLQTLGFSGITLLGWASRQQYSSS